MTSTEPSVRAQDVEETGKGVCRTCCRPIYNEGGTIGGRRRDKGWSDRIERGGDSLVCFSAIEYRHEPLVGREAAIYDKAHAAGYEQGYAEAAPLRSCCESHRGHRHASDCPALAAALAEPAIDACLNHKPVQHRDAKRPWCNHCGRAADGELIGQPRG